MMGKTMNEIGKTLFPNLTEERRQQIIADFGNEEINYLSQNRPTLRKYPTTRRSSGNLPGGRESATCSTSTTASGSM